MICDALVSLFVHVGDANVQGDFGITTLSYKMEWEFWSKEVLIAPEKV